MSDRLVHLAAISKANLDFGRMDVDVDPHRVDFDEQYPAGLAVAVQHVLVGRSSAVVDQPVADEAPIDIGVLLVGAGARGIGQADAAPDTHC